MKKRVFLLLVMLAGVQLSHADLWDLFKKKTNDATTASLAGFSQREVTEAIKQVLGNGVEAAVTNLSRPNGFLSNVQVRIPMPENLQIVERGLRALKQDRYADDFVAAMNRAAEQAVAESLPIFTDALKTMSIEDAKRLAIGGEDSATQFFKGKGEKQIQEKMLPIIKDATARTGVTSAYKKLLDQAGGSALFGKLKIDASSLDVDNHVTRKASDGLFKMIAEEEKRIRENPQARTTELLRRVFGVLK